MKKILLIQLFTENKKIFIINAIVKITLSFIHHNIALIESI